MPRGTVIFVILVGVAICAESPTAAMTVGRVGPASADSSRSAECQHHIEAIFQRATLGRSRVVVTFTGLQRSLMPLYESPFVGEFDVTLFPIDRTRFVLTLQVSPTSADPARVSLLANQLCTLAQQGGARFNGVILYEGNEMTAAEMADPEH
jgi:hypothetical protein